MTISEGLLPEFDQEMANTRTTLERVPDEKLGWKPHEKSFAMGALAQHVATMVGWTVDAIKKDSFDISPGGEPYRPPELKSRQEILAAFDSGVAGARAAIAGASDVLLFKPWSLLNIGTPVMTMPRLAVIRNFVMNHTIHHRAQLGVYLRLNNIAVPSIYGPSADEGAF